MSLSADEVFRNFSDLLSQKDIAVAVSGGPDSMALAVLLFGWLQGQEWTGTLHALSVDHGLRAESAAEAQAAGAWLRASCPGIRHSILRWEGAKPSSRVQEEARRARHALITAYCRKRGIAHVFLAHHQDDQAETFLMRLAAGSGLDGLSGMAERQKQEEITLLRPLLACPKAALVEFCREQKIPYVEDPSNRMGAFARVRLREAAKVLEREGLSAKRLSLTAKRLARAREVLEAETEKFMAVSLKRKDTDRFVFFKSVWSGAYEEIVFRAVRKVLQELGTDEESGYSYGPRTERMEALADDLLKSEPFRKRTLGGVVVWADGENDEIVFRKEAAKKR